MTAPDIQTLLTELRAEHNRLSTAVNLQHKQAELQSLEDDLDTLSKTVQSLSKNGYADAVKLSAHVESLSNALNRVRVLFGQALTTASARLKAELGQAEPAIKVALDGKGTQAEALLDYLKTLAPRLELAESQLDSLIDPIEDARYTLNSQFSVLSWSLEEWNEFSGDRNAHGSLLIAAEAEWKQSGRGGDDPDGVLYLTDKALIFEQKEKKGKTLGMFGGKMVQEVEFVLPLGGISDVRAKNEGMFGGRDILFISVSSGDPAPEVKVEVKGSADNKLWATYISKASQNHDLFETPMLTPPALDLSAWSGALPEAPEISLMAGIGGALAAIKAQQQADAAADAAADLARSMFGQKKADDDDDDKKPSGAGGMRGLAQKLSQDDDDDEKGAPKGGQKPMGGGRKDD